MELLSLMNIGYGILEREITRKLREKHVRLREIPKKIIYIM